ncbi:MAG: GNAT family N-acetyltransferase [Dehalococcoidales bacterium]|nr:GNAT family N-acetyltransferase [Dehalococcoidales bacterium]
MTNVIMRQYRASDYAACIALYKELAQRHAEVYEDPTIAAHDFKQVFDEYLGRSDRRGTWVAVMDDRVVGIIGLLDRTGEKGVCEIEPMVVSTDSRGEGIGSKLVAYVKEETKKKGYRFFTVRPELRNEQAFKFYVKLGFNLVGGVELFQDLSPELGRTWKSGIEILGQKLRY